MSEILVRKTLESYEGDPRRFDDTRLWRSDRIAFARSIASELLKEEVAGEEEGPKMAEHDQHFWHKVVGRFERKSVVTEEEMRLAFQETNSWYAKNYPCARIKIEKELVAE